MPLWFRQSLLLFLLFKKEFESKKIVLLAVLLPAIVMYAAHLQGENGTVPSAQPK
jgi:hypothetical protein